MNPNSLQKTLPGKKIKQWVVLSGYQRCFTVPIDGYLYLSLLPVTQAKVGGVLIKITKSDLAKLKKREIGYRCADVTGQIQGVNFENIYTFIGPSEFLPEFSILKSYIVTCLKYVPYAVRKRWEKETIIKNKIEDDLKKPKYQNANF